MGINYIFHCKFPFASVLVIIIYFFVVVVVMLASMLTGSSLKSLGKCVISAILL